MGRVGSVFLSLVAMWLLLQLVDAHLSSLQNIHHHGDGDDDGCGTHDPSPQERQLYQQLMAKDPAHRVLEEAPNFTIPVHFVVLQAKDGRGNITDGQIENHLFATLKDSFKGSPFNFELKGIERAFNDGYFKCNETLETEFKMAYRRGGMETLNIFLCNLFAMDRWGLYGVADLPLPYYNERDAVILMNPVLNRTGVSMLLQEYILVHETGHWLGLFHTFTGGCSADGNDDQVDDTPAHFQKTSKYSCGRTCCQNNTRGPLNTCPDDEIGVDPGPDPVDNFMNYLYKQGGGDKGICYRDYGRFTPGQMQRMVLMYKELRMNNTRTDAPTMAPIVLHTVHPTNSSDPVTQSSNNDTEAPATVPSTEAPVNGTTEAPAQTTEKTAPPATERPTSSPKSVPFPSSLSPTSPLKSESNCVCVAKISLGLCAVLLVVL